MGSIELLAGGAFAALAAALQVTGDPVSLPALPATRILLTVAATMFLAGVALLPLGRYLKRLAQPVPERGVFAFRPLDVAVVALGFVWLQLAVAFALNASDVEVEGLFGALVGSTALQAAAVALVLWIAARRPGGFAALGVRPASTPRSLAYGGIAYGAALPFLYALIALTPILAEYVGEYEPQDVALKIAAASPDERWLVALFVVAILPLCEEVIFRGFMQGAFEPRLGPKLAVVVTSVAFGLLHGLSAFVPIFALSIVLGRVMLHTRSLAACWLVHAMHNGITTAWIFFAPETLGGT